MWLKPCYTAFTKPSAKADGNKIKQQNFFYAFKLQFTSVNGFN
jgi:hypothetical protein